MIKINPSLISEDKRGKFFRVIKDKTWKEMNFLECKKDSIRGQHYHKKITELFFLVDGEMNVIIENVKTNEKRTFKMREYNCIVVEPYEKHTLKAIKDSKVISLLNKNFNMHKPDLFRK